MIDLNLSGVNYDLSDKIKRYVDVKIGGLDKFLPKNKRQAAGKVILTMDQSGREDNQCVAEVTIQVAGAVVTAKEATINMFAAVDIVEAKLKSQILKYKDKHSPRFSRRQKLINRLFGKPTA